MTDDIPADRTREAPAAKDAHDRFQIYTIVVLSLIADSRAGAAP
jgi:hypothetical protein